MNKSRLILVKDDEPFVGSQIQALQDPAENYDEGVPPSTVAHSLDTVQEAATPIPAAVPLSIGKSAAYIAASGLLWVTQGLGMNFVAVNTQQIQGHFGATLTETTWLMAAYAAPNASLSLILIKIRTQFGLRSFAQISIGVFVLASLLNLFIDDLHSAIAIRFLAGIVGSPLSTLAFLYMLEAFPPARKSTWGLSLALTLSSAGPALARIVSPRLLDIDLFHGLYVAEMGLAALSAAAVHLLPLTPIPRAKVLHFLDFITYPLVAVAFGLLAVVLTLGRYYWWLEAPWIGWCIALAFLSIGVAGAIEINRKTPLINLRWLGSREMLHLIAVLLVFRIVLSEQTSGAVGLLQTLGLLNAQMQGLFILILIASAAGGITCAALVKVERVPTLHAAALLLICVGAFLDSHATNLTRPPEMYVSQALIAFGGALFLPPSLLTGMMAIQKQGPAYLTSFVVIFLFTQTIGGLIASALFGSFVIVREKFHSSYIVEHLTLADPLVADRIRLLAGAFGKVLTDSQLMNAEGAALLAQRATQEANVLAYNDAFLVISAIAAIALVALVGHLLLVRIRDRIVRFKFIGNDVKPRFKITPQALVPIRAMVPAVVALVGALLVLYAWRLPPFRNSVETTEDAYVEGDVTIISPQLAGYIKAVDVRDYQKVKAGDAIVEIDSRTYEQRLMQAQAALAIQKANLANSDQAQHSAEAKIDSSQAQVTSTSAAQATAQANAGRTSTLLAKGAGTQTAADQANLSLDQARAAVLQAKAALEVSQQDLQTIVVGRQSLEAMVQNAEAAVRLAQIDLQNTRVIAPKDGKLSSIGARTGQYVAPGTQLASLVPPDKWIIANFEEGQVYGMKLGQPVQFYVDALRHEKFQGHIQEFSPATGSEFSVLKADNATGNFTKVAQRLSIRISIDANQPAIVNLMPGMSVEVKVDTTSAPDGPPR